VNAAEAHILGTRTPVFKSAMVSRPPRSSANLRRSLSAGRTSAKKPQ
jgi:hypothetical protein